MTRREGRHDAESLLAVAAEVFTERGYDGTSMEHLAAAAGITKSSFYHHVDGKEDLLRLSLDRALDGLFAVLESEGARTGPAIDRLEHVLRGSVHVLVERLPHVTLLLRVRGNTEVQRRALSRRASSTPPSPSSCGRPRRRATCGRGPTAPSPPVSCSG